MGSSTLLEGELPEGWAETTIKDLSDSIQYGYTAKKSGNNFGPKYLRITDIQDNKVQWENVPSCVIAKTEIEKYQLNKGDILFARTGATVGKSFLIENLTEDSIFASYLIRVVQIGRAHV